jgi:hypothetical protein
MAGHDFWQKLAPLCGYADCVHSRSPWGRIRRRSLGVFLQGTRYCQAGCLELALKEVLEGARPVPHRAAVASHRIPLGLLLLSRKQLAACDLRTALEAQRTAGRGKIGEWLQQLGFATESQITAALARQWSCPVLRTRLGTIGASRFPPIPLLLLEAFQMIPVDLVQSTGTLLIAFSEGIDYTVLYAIEQMLGYRTEACLVCPSSLQKSLQALARHRESKDVVFDRVQDAGECARIIGSYAANMRAREVRLAQCGEHLWIRLERLRQDAVNLVLHVPTASSQFPVLSSQFPVPSSQ